MIIISRSAVLLNGPVPLVHWFTRLLKGSFLLPWPLRGSSLGATAHVAPRRNRSQGLVVFVHGSGAVASVKCRIDTRYPEGDQDDEWKEVPQDLEDQVAEELKDD